MTKVVVFGYFGCGNVGDETNLSQLINLLREIDRGMAITAISVAAEQTAEPLVVNTVGKYHLMGIYHALKDANLLIGGGGSLFQDQTSLRSLIFYSGLVLGAKCLKVKVFLYGQGIGPLRTRMGKWLAGLALGRSDLITVRDRVSLIALADLNVKKPEIHFTAEPLLVKEKVAKQLVISYWERIKFRKLFKVGLIIRQTSLVKQRFWDELTDCLNWDHNVELFILNIDQKDREFNQRIALKKGIKLLDPITTWEGLQAVVGGFDLVLSTRLHGLVAAVVQGIPCYGLAVDPKIDGFCLQWGIPFQVLTTESEPLTLGNKVIDFLQQPLEQRLSWRSQRDFWRARALENQVLLKQFIQGQL